MEKTTNNNRKQGGRPTKAVKQKYLLGVKCNLVEKKMVLQNAKAVGVTVSEFLRNVGLKRQAVRKVKVLPQEVLLRLATLNHIAANLNQVAKKRNRFDELNAIERAGLIQLANDLKQLVIDIKNYLS